MQRTPRVTVVCAVRSVTSADVYGQRNICSASCEEELVVLVKEVRLVLFTTIVNATHLLSD